MNSILVFASGEAGLHWTFFFHDVKEMAFTAVASLIVIGLIWWKGMPAARTMLEGRTERIEKEINEAEKARSDAETRLSEVQARIANAENERQRILVEARQTAEAVKQQIAARAAEEADEAKARAAADIESSKAQAVADLHAEVATLAIGAAEAVIAANLDAGTQNELIDGYIQQVGA